jgi:hypothetical protein
MRTLRVRCMDVTHGSTGFHTGFSSKGLFLLVVAIGLRKPCQHRLLRPSGDERDRTANLLVANQAWLKSRSQLRGGCGRRQKGDAPDVKLRRSGLAGCRQIHHQPPALVHPRRFGSRTMPDPLRAKLASESAAGMASASISPPGAIRNRVHLACVTCYEMLRVSGFSKICEIGF